MYSKPVGYTKYTLTIANKDVPLEQIREKDVVETLLVRDLIRAEERKCSKRRSRIVFMSGSKRKKIANRARRGAKT